MSMYDPYAAEPSEMERAYELLRVLGGDDGLAVHLARERATGRLVVIEIAHPRDRGDLDELDHLHRAASALTSLEHANLVSVLATFGMRDGGVAIARSFVEGRSLAEMVREDGALSARTAGWVLRDVLRGLAALHVRGFVHRDVRPEHVFVDESGERAMLAGLSSARPVDGRTALGAWESLHRPPNYLAPEQVAGAMMDARSDVYGAGLVAWTMLTGRRPWDGESVYAIAAKQTTIELPSVASLRDDVPARLEAAVGRALRKVPDERWPSVRAMSIALGDGLDARGTRAAPADVATPARSRDGSGDGSIAAAARAPRKPTRATWTPTIMTAGGSGRHRRPRRARAAIITTFALLLAVAGGAFYVLRGDRGEKVTFASAAGTVAVRPSAAHARPGAAARAKRTEPPAPSTLARVAEVGPRVAASAYTSPPIRSSATRAGALAAPREIGEAAVGDLATKRRRRALIDSLRATRAESIATVRRRAARDSAVRPRVDSAGGTRRDSVPGGMARPWVDAGARGAP